MRISDWSSDVCSSDLLIGTFAFNAARQICCRRCPTRCRAVHLTDRQRDCVILVAQGKTDWEIGKIFGLKKDSVTKVIDAARMRYDVANRTEDRKSTRLNSSH